MKLIRTEEKDTKKIAKSKDINCCVLEGVFLMFTNDLHSHIARNGKGEIPHRLQYLIISQTRATTSVRMCLQIIELSECSTVCL